MYMYMRVKTQPPTQEQDIKRNNLLTVPLAGDLTNKDVAISVFGIIQPR